MAKRIDKLKREGKGTAKWRGHNLSTFKTITKAGTNIIMAEARCKKCNRIVIVNTHPAPNEIDIGGSAVAMNCKSSGNN